MVNEQKSLNLRGMIILVCSYEKGLVTPYSVHLIEGQIVGYIFSIELKLFNLIKITRN